MAVGIPLMLLVAAGSQAVPQIRATIGEDPGNADYQFGRIADMAITSSGDVVVLDEMSHNVRVFSADGRLLSVIGRQGNGPEEFASPVGLDIDKADRIWVVDPENSRVSIWSTGGELVRSHRLPSDITLYPWPGRLDRNDNLYSYTGTGEFGLALVRYDQALNPIDTVFPPEAGEDAYFETRTQRWGTVRAAVPYAARVIWRLGVDGQVYHTTGTRYEIFRSRDNRGVVARHTSPIPVTSAEREAALESLSRFVEHGGRIDPRRVPDRKPPISSFFVDRRGHFWVMPALPANHAGSILEEFSDDGTYLRTLHLPDRILSYPEPAYRDGILAVALEDEFGTPLVRILAVD